MILQRYHLDRTFRSKLKLEHRQSNKLKQCLLQHKKHQDKRNIFKFVRSTRYFELEVQKTMTTPKTLASQSITS